MIRVIAILLVATTATSGKAQELKLSELRAGDVAKLCLDALQNAKPADEFGEELLSRKNFSLGPENAAKGVQCLETLYGAKFEYSGERFGSAELVAAIEREANLNRERLEKNRAAYQTAVKQTCYEKYSVDKFTALTTDVCGEVFNEFGLP